MVFFFFRNIRIRAALVDRAGLKARIAFATKQANNLTPIGASRLMENIGKLAEVEEILKYLGYKEDVK